MNEEHKAYFAMKNILYIFIIGLLISACVQQPTQEE